MKTKKIRRIACVMLALAILAVITVPAFAAELFGSSYPIRWSDQVGSTYRFCWMDYNVSDNNEDLAAQLASGMQYWGIFSNVQLVETSTSSTGTIHHSIPTTTWWDTINADYGWGNIMGMAHVYDTAGYRITISNVATSTRLVRNAIYIIDHIKNILMFSSMMLHIVA